MEGNERTPAISVIITTKNRIKELKRAIQSVLSQTFNDYELIIVDDGSSDGTLRLLENLERKYSFFRFFSLKKSEKRSGNYARNIGIKNANAEIIAMLDDDDRWFPEKLQKQFELLLNKPDSDFVYCGVSRIIDNRYRLDKTAAYMGDLSSEVLRRMICLTSTMMYRKSLWKKVGGFDENISHWQDYEFTIRAFQNTVVACVPQPLVFISVDTKKKSRLSNQYFAWKKSIMKIEKKHLNLIKSKKDVTFFDFENVVLEDSANRLYGNGKHLAYQKKMLALGRRTRNFKYIVRGIFCIPSTFIQKVKGKKFSE